jgi:nucleoid-associated protein EbfC
VLNIKPNIMMDMFGKLGEVKKKMDEIRQRLDHITVQGEAGNEAVSVIVTANRKVKSIQINDAFMQTDKREELQELLEVAMNRALEKAEQVSEAEMKAAGRDFLPGFPGF